MADRDEPAEPTAAVGEVAVGDVVAGRFRLLERRGTRDDVVLFEALDEMLDEPVALRVVTAVSSGAGDLAERCLSALREVAAVPAHPNLPQLIDLGVTERDGVRMPYVAGELMAGGSLRDMLDRGRTLTLSQVVLVGLQVCAALDALHRAGITHGAVRPSNILFAADGRVRLGDAGLGAVMAAERAARGEPVTLDVARYATPELAAGLPVGPAGDIYALALCLWEAATGEVPFAGESATATLANRIDRLLPVSADLGPLAAVLERSARPDPTDRWTAGEFGRALVQVAEKLPRPEPLPLAPGAARESDTTGGQARPDAQGFVAFGAPDREGPTTDAPRPAEPLDAPAGEWRSLDTAVHPPGAEDGAPAEPPAGDGAAAGSIPPATDGAGTPARLPLPWWRRRVTTIGLALVLVAAIAAAGFWLTRPERHDVPALAGLLQGEALNQVSEFDWEIVIAEQFDDTVPIGVVVATDPAAGTPLTAGSSLTVTVSAGPAPRELPEIGGLDVADAETLLVEQGLVMQLADQPFDEAAPVGTVLSWSVPDQPGLVAGDTVVPGTVVSVVVSAGPAPRTVPDLVGVGVAEAAGALESLGLVMSQLPDEFSTTVPVGSVVRTDPPAGAQVARGATVAIVLSKGPDLVTVPPLAALTPDQARAELERAGLVLGQVKGDPAGIVVLAEANGQVLVAYAQLPRGTAVDISCMQPVPGGG